VAAKPAQRFYAGNKIYKKLPLEVAKKYDTGFFSRLTNTKNSIKDKESVDQSFS
jgi:hypothetical protein